MTELCFDVMELVGQNVSRCREEKIVRTRYGSVVSVMNGIFREAYDYGCDMDNSWHEQSPRLQWLEDDYEYYVAGDPRDCDGYDIDGRMGQHGCTFISDFKDCLRRYTIHDPELGTVTHSHAKWSWGWGSYSSYHTLSSPPPPGKLIWVDKIRYEIYGNTD